MRYGAAAAIGVWISGKLALRALRAWLYHWLRPRPDVLLKYLMDAGYPPDATHSSLVVMLDSDEDRARFHQAMCYAIDMALRETNVGDGG